MSGHDLRSYDEWMDDQTKRRQALNAALPAQFGLIADWRRATDAIGPRHRTANRWHFDLRWEWEPHVMRAWLDGEVPDVTIVRKPGHG